MILDKKSPIDEEYEITFYNPDTRTQVTKFSDNWPGIEPLERAAKQGGYTRIKIVKITRTATEYII